MMSITVLQKHPVCMARRSSPCHCQAHAIPNSVPGGHISKKFDEVLWPTDSESHSHCVCISTTHRYNPSLNDSKGGWGSSWDMEEHDGVRDFFYMKSQEWYYLGTYEWVGQGIYPCNELRALIDPVSPVDESVLSVRESLLMSRSACTTFRKGPVFTPMCCPPPSLA